MSEDVKITRVIAYGIASVLITLIVCITFGMYYGDPQAQCSFGSIVVSHTVHPDRSFTTVCTPDPYYAANPGARR